MGENLKTRRKLALPTRMLLALVLGAIAGLVIGKPVTYFAFIGDIFIKLLKMCMYPLILVSIMQGISQVTDMRRLKKVGIGFFWYWALSGLFIGLVGVVLTFVVKPGVGIDMGVVVADEAVKMNFVQNIVAWVPDNPFGATAAGDVLQIVIVALIFGLILTSMPESKSKTILVEALDALNLWVGKVIAWVVELAPYGVFIIMANMVATIGGTTIGSILKMLLTMYLIFIIIFAVIYPLILIFVAKVNPIQFYKNAMPSLIMAFSTCSSNASIPVTMKTSKENMGVPADIVNLITAPAATLNMHSNCMQTPLYCIFAAQLYNLPLTPLQLGVTIILGLISAVGAAGVPGGGFLMITLVLQVMDLPLTIVPWIIGIYTLIDMPGTMANVCGDIVGMVVVSSKLGELNRDVFNSKKKLEKNKAIA